MRRPDSLSSRRWFFVALTFYLLFAVLVFIVQGPAPELSIDHIAYFQMTDDVLARYPDGRYWRSFSSLKSYAVILAYLHDLTGSHIESLKYLLAVMTVGYLFAFQLLMSLFTDARATAMLFALLSAFFVSFGASFWGLTEFYASLNRTILLPFFVLAVWWAIRWYRSPLRFLVFPVLVSLSVFHLSSYYLFLVLLVFEGFDFLLRRRARIDRNLAYFALALALSVAMRELLERLGLGSTRFLETALLDGAGGMTPQELWDLELYSFPWRNMPLPLTTLANMVLSFGVIFLLGATGAIRAFRAGPRASDQWMLMFAAAVPVAAYGLQTTIWCLRQFAPIHPFNFEEVRAINFIMIPASYFCFRLFQSLGSVPQPKGALLRVALVAAFLFQPIMLLKAIPGSRAEQLLAWATSAGLLKPQDSLRTLYARQYLGLTTRSPRFYYSTEGLIGWLKRNGRFGDRVLTDRNELVLAGYPVVGAFQLVMKLRVADQGRRTWREDVEAVSDALASGDTGTVLDLARRSGATLAVVPWPVTGAEYRDKNFSLVRVGAL